MLGLKRKLHYFKNKQNFLDWFFSRPDHAWIEQDRYIKANLLDFFDSLSLKAINKIFETEEVVLAPSSGMFACSVQGRGKSVIIVFPELKRLLKAPFSGWAKAVLAHEFGHLYHGHAGKFIDPLEAQIEADTFAIDMGYGPQLAEFLEERPESIEKRTRLAYVTSRYFQDQ